MSTDTTDTTTVTSTLVERFRDYTRNYLDNREGEPSKLSRLLQRYPSEQESITIDWRNIYQFDPDLADDVLDRPEEIQAYAEEAIATYDVPVDVDLSGVTVRFANLPADAEREIGKFGISDEDTLRRVSGQVTKKSAKRIRVTKGVWECGRCGTFTDAIPQTGGKQEPHECQGCERQGPFQLRPDKSERVNYQRLRLQLPPELSNGTASEHVDAIAEGELVNTVEVGDKVTATIIPRTHEVDSDDELILDWHAQSVHLEPEDAGLDDIDYSDSIDEIRELAGSEHPLTLLVDSIKPTHRGHENAKLAIALQLFGGVRKINADGSKVRAEPHVLLVGDPGTDKTGLLSYAADLAPRSVFTSGEGSSGVGLTAAVVSDDFSDSPTLEAGAMVLADRGLVALDEFDKLSDDQQKSMNEALSRQTVSISKWGINATLNSRTTLLAAANPEYGRFDRYEPIAQQIDMDPTLISRFDLIFVIKDVPDEDEDRQLAEHINRSAYVGAKRARGDRVDAELEQDITPAVEPVLLRKWVAYARENVVPVMTEDAQEFIRDEYVKLRMASDDGDAVPVTARLLQGLHRLTEASAKVRLSERAELRDAKIAVAIARDCLKEVGVDPDTGEFDADVIETGRSMTQQKRVKAIKGIVESHEPDYERGAHISDIADDAERLDISREQVEHELQKLKDQGKLYSPGENYYRTT